MQLVVRLRRVASSPPRIDDTSIGALLAPADHADRRRAFAVLAEPALAAALVGRALRRPGPRVVDPSRPQPSLAGALAALLVAAARRNGLAPLRVLAAGAAPALLGEVVSVDPVPLGATLTVVVEHDAFVAHVFAPRSALQPARGALTVAALAALGAMPLELPLVAGVLESTAAELATLAPGDVLAPLGLSRAGAAVRGELLLAAPASDVAFAAELGEDGRLVLREGPLPIAPEPSPMVDKDALAQSIGETPVVIRVEVGSAQMTAREWAALGAGDVVALGKRVGEHVVLRVGGAEVARGELVDVEGGIGVRIVARAGGTVA